MFSTVLSRTIRKTDIYNNNFKKNSDEISNWNEFIDTYNHISV